MKIMSALFEVANCRARHSRALGKLFLGPIEQAPRCPTLFAAQQRHIPSCLSAQLLVIMVDYSHFG